MTEQTGDVLADIDAALEGWHGTDTISPDAMRWAPEPPPGDLGDRVEQLARIFDVPPIMLGGLRGVRGMVIHY